MNDKQFLSAFEQRKLTAFAHRDHIRMAWLYLRANEWEAARHNICAGIRHFAAAHGTPGKYHETMTEFWARVIHKGMVLAPDAVDFEQFIAQHPHLLDKSLIYLHYSRELLATEAARQGWIEPDLLPLG